MSLDFEKTRRETEAKLAGRTGALATGEDTAALEPFAKAYLGLYLDLDNSVAPVERVKMFASDTLLPPVLQGFKAVLQESSLPEPKTIGHALTNGERYPVGYVALAGMHLLAEEEHSDLDTLSEPVLASLLCFHLCYPTELEDHWFDSLMQKHPQLAARCLQEFWSQIMDEGSQYLPGLRGALRDADMTPVIRRVVLTVLAYWIDYDKYFLRSLLTIAIRHAERDRLLSICNNMVERLEELPLQNRVYWLTTAFLLDPETHADTLFEFVGRTREKAVPMLKFLLPILDEGAGEKLVLPAWAVARLLHMLAPKFAPRKDQFGRIDDNAERVLWLLNYLARIRTPEGCEALASLRRIRVMRVYSDYLDAAERVQKGG